MLAFAFSLPKGPLRTKNATTIAKVREEVQVELPRMGHLRTSSPLPNITTLAILIFPEHRDFAKAL